MFRPSTQDLMEGDSVVSEHHVDVMDNVTATSKRAESLLPGSQEPLKDV